MTDQQRQKNTFSDPVLREIPFVEEQIANVLQGRPHVKGITIDGPLSKDLDDAFWLERDPEGGYRLDISIADVSSVVTSLTPALDQEVQQRAFTRYGVEENIPMLPRPLSEAALSLLPGQLRPTFTLSLSLDAQLRVGEPVITQTVICSKQRFSYEDVDRDLEHTESAFASMLRDALYLAQRLLQLRRARGALALYDLLSGWATTEEGVLVQLPEVNRHRGHLIIQEFMILANQTFATYLAERDVLALYRNHRAKAIAPERAQLVDMMEDAVQHPGHVPTERVRATVNLAMERARYAPTITGHYGLNLPVYLHMTSPLRRYPDLLNQRILNIVLRGAPLTSTRADLEAVARHINAEEDAMKDDKKRFFRQEYDEQIRTIVPEGTQEQAAQRLEALEAKQFHSVLRLAAEEHRLSPEIEQEITRRLEQHGLQVHDLFTLLFRFQNTGEAWNRVKQNCLQWLQQHPQHAVNLLVMGHQILGWPEPDIASEGPDQHGVFRVTLTQHVAQQSTTAVGTAIRKNLAKQRACAVVVAQLTGIAPLEFQEEHELSHAEPVQVVSSLSEDKKVVEAQDDKKQLHELVQVRQWNRVVYTVVERTGPSHAPTFCVEASIIVDGTVYTARGSGRTKTQAEHEAAHYLLRALPQALSDPAIETEPKNAVSFLNEMMQQGKIQKVTYTYNSSGPSHDPSFTCFCAITTRDGSRSETIAYGATKKDAAQHAARFALETCWSAITRDESRRPDRC